MNFITYNSGVEPSDGVVTSAQGVYRELQLAVAAGTAITFIIVGSLELGGTITGNTRIECNSLVSFEGAWGTGSTLLIDDGIQLLNIRSLKNLTINCQGTALSSIVASTGIELSAVILYMQSVPAIEVTPGESPSITISDGFTLIRSNFAIPVISMSGSTALSLKLTDAGEYSFSYYPPISGSTIPNLFGGLVTDTVNVWHDDSIGVLYNPAFLGTLGVETLLSQDIGLSLNTGVSGSRPSNSLQVGQRFFDTGLNIPIWWNGTVWVNASGTTV